MKKISEQGSEIISIFDENKLLILRELFLCKEDVCGCNMVEKIGISKDLLSYHIKKLRNAGLVEEEKCGHRKIYTIAKDRLKKVEQILKIVELIS